MKEQEYRYVIKDYTDDDFSKIFTSTSGYLSDIAEEIAEEYWAQDPSDPSNFKCEVGIIDYKDEPHWFSVYAEASVNFYSSEI